MNLCSSFSLQDLVQLKTTYFFCFQHCSMEFQWGLTLLRHRDHNHRYVRPGRLTQCHKTVLEEIDLPKIKTLKNSLL